MNRKADTPFSLCVYCGSRMGDDPAYEASARQVGTLIGLRGWRLVYGGGRAGLMGVVADATLAAGGTAVGIIPHALMSRELGHGALTELHVVDTMHERKRMMAERADALVALPGGIGTFEELFEVWTWRQLGYHDQADRPAERCRLLRRVAGLPGQDRATRLPVDPATRPADGVRRCRRPAHAAGHPGRTGTRNRDDFRSI